MMHTYACAEHLAVESLLTFKAGKDTLLIIMNIGRS